LIKDKNKYINKKYIRLPYHDTFYNFDILFYHCYERIKNNLPALTLVWSFPIPTSKVILIRIRKEAIVLV